MIITC